MLRVAKVMPVQQQITVEDYERMIEEGILTENDRLELIRGELVEKMSIGGPHASCVNRLNRLFHQRLGDRAVISVQNPVRIGDSVPEPDVVLLLPRDDFYRDRLPLVKDVILIIEVADSSVAYDRGNKLSLYAEFGVSEYWIVNLVDNCIEIYRGPKATGEYSDIQVLKAEATAGVPGFPDVVVSAGEIL